MLMIFFPDEIALKFLNYRRPQSKSHGTRLPHIADYILAELPLFVAGIRYGETNYQSLLYPTACPGKCDALANLVYEIHTTPEFADLKRDILGASSTVATKGQFVLPMTFEDTRRG